MLLRLLRYSVPVLVVAMIVVPLLVVNPPSEPRMTHDGSVSMGHEEFGARHLTVHVGSSIVLRNSSHWLHVIVPGVEAHTERQSGLPSLGMRDAHISETGDVFRYGPFDTPGRYHLTCSLHPEMNLTVDVVR
jgi:plastocyanin